MRLSLEKLEREVEIQEGIFITLKQQLELAKIEEVQKASIIQILDYPQVPLGPNNKNIINGIILAAIFGLGLGVFVGFIRFYLQRTSSSEKMKIRKTQKFLKYKTLEILSDKRMSGTIAATLSIGLPFYLSHKSQSPTFFGRYSISMMIMIVTFSTLLILSILSFYRQSRNN